MTVERRSGQKFLRKLGQFGAEDKTYEASEGGAKPSRQRNAIFRRQMSAGFAESSTPRKIFDVHR